VTASTYRKTPHSISDQRRDFLLGQLFDGAEEFNWALQAWAIMPNHYHFIALSLGDSSNVGRMISKLHMLTAKHINSLDHKPGRRVWFQYWDTRLTYERSYLARLRYVNNNPVHHGLIDNALLYPWCSAAWFERNAAPAFRRTVNSFKIDRLSVPDDY
jgi:putative transposase